MRNEKYTHRKYNILGADLTDLELINKFNKWTLFLLLVIDFFRKYVWVAFLKDRKGVTITNAFQKILMNQDANQTKYGKTEAANFTIDQWNYG